MHHIQLQRYSGYMDFRKPAVPRLDPGCAARQEPIAFLDLIGYYTQSMSNDRSNEKSAILSPQKNAIFLSLPGRTS